MDRKKILLLGGLALVVIILTALIIRDFRQPEPEPAGPIVVPVGTDGIEPVLDIPADTNNDGDPFREEAPVVLQVPGANEVLPASQREEVAVPTVVVPAAPGVESSFRNFNISGQDGKFIPEKIIVKLGDTVHINFTAVDRDYDIVFPSYNMSQAAKQGQTKILEFQALADGSFLYYCESCGGAEGTAKGNIIIVK